MRTIKFVPRVPISMSSRVELLDSKFPWSSIIRISALPSTVAFIVKIGIQVKGLLKQGTCLPSTSTTLVGVFHIQQDKMASARTRATKDKRLSSSTPPKEAVVVAATGGQLLDLDLIVEKNVTAISLKPEDLSVCTNCSTQISPIWRKGRNGENLCNACGLYWNINRVYRPLEAIPNRFSCKSKRSNAIQSSDSDALLSSVTRRRKDREVKRKPISVLSNEATAELEVLPSI